MQPTQVREKVLGDHRVLRLQLRALENLAREVIHDPRIPVAALRASAKRFLEALRTHMHWEDLQLVPALEESDAWGPERAARLTDHHREQRTFLAGVLEELHDQQQAPAVVANSLLDLARLLFEDMDEEEAFFLDPDVLRDDVIGIDVEAG